MRSLIQKMKLRETEREREYVENEIFVGERRERQASSEMQSPNENQSRDSHSDCSRRCDHREPDHCFWISIWIWIWIFNSHSIIYFRPIGLTKLMFVFIKNK
jgi:hypothetical protein